ncbi:MAG TPA: hypothetical protein VH475_08030 [Tepidisphaeraceae bacterium]|jgi:hypothetical protein
MSLLLQRARTTTRLGGLDVSRRDSRLHAGHRVDANVTDFPSYDLMARLPKKRSRRLAVLKA